LHETPSASTRGVSDAGLMPIPNWIRHALTTLFPGTMCRERLQYDAKAQESTDSPVENRSDALFHAN
jgi:hypothetical protein